jgi:hypothetical protein
MVFVAAGFSLRSFFFQLSSQAKACGYILNADG